MTDEIVVRVEEANPPEINVSVTDTGPTVEVVVSEIGLPGPKGDPGQDSADSGNMLDAHVHSTHPHPVYDDPDLVLLYENAKV